VDKGALIRVVMNGVEEFIGRPLNIAARLQGAIKDRGGDPASKVLISNNAYDGMRTAVRAKMKVQSARRKLRNISGDGYFECKKVFLV
jgi:class 3 adenylate cyclase